MVLGGGEYVDARAAGILAGLVVVAVVAAVAMLACVP